MVALIFSIESVTANSSRIGIIEITIPSQIKNLKLLGPNSRVKNELEVIFNLKPQEYSNIVKIEIPLNDARRIVKSMTGIDLPTKINGVTEANQLVDKYQRLDLITSEKFYLEALKYNVKK